MINFPWICDKLEALLEEKWPIPDGPTIGNTSVNQVKVIILICPRVFRVIDLELD